MDKASKSTKKPIGIRKQKIVEELEPEQERPEVDSENDLVDYFFSRILYTIVDDLSILEPDVSTVHAYPEEGVYYISFDDITEEDLNKADIISVDATASIFKMKYKDWDYVDKDAVSLDMVIPRNKSMSWHLDPSRRHMDSSFYSSRTSIINSFQEVEIPAGAEIRIVFKNGAIYEGKVKNKIMHGSGKYLWADGTAYEGDFVDGYPTGSGQMVLPDLSTFQGQFNHGFFHGKGVLNIASTAIFHCGDWYFGQKQGKAWLFIGPQNFYSGQWTNDLPHGMGVRQYTDCSRYKGEWEYGKKHGQGMMVWENRDYYRGQWCHDKIEGEGEYVWRVHKNTSFAFPVYNSYSGSWMNGQRNGEGTLFFGASSGAKLIGTFEQGVKHGPGYLICGNGKTVTHPNLFCNDKAGTNTYPDGTTEMLTLPIFTKETDVELDYYVDKILDQIKEDMPEEKFEELRMLEIKHLRDCVMISLLKLKEKYQIYAIVASDNEKFNFLPVMIRLFLWQLYRDIDIYELGLSLADTDEFLAENPASCVDSLHDPFEKIYFWQFIMSLIGVGLINALRKGDIEYNNISGDTCCNIVQEFFDKNVLAIKATKNSLVFDHFDLIPVKAMYALYQSLGEPITARELLRKTAVKKIDPPPCHWKKTQLRSILTIGNNRVSLGEHIYYKKDETRTSTGDVSYEWQDIRDFYRLGPKNIVKCIKSICPLIVCDDYIVDMEYTLCFLEFYEIILQYIFLFIELRLQHEKRTLIPEKQELSKAKQKRKSNRKLHSHMSR